MRDILGDCNIVEFLYGKDHESTAHPVIGFDAPLLVLTGVLETCARAGIHVEDVSAGEDTRRIIAYEAAFRDPLFHYEFPERAGALHEFLGRIEDLANICYFNYQYRRTRRPCSDRPRIRGCRSA